MSIPNRDELYAKLEADGEINVREKLAQGVYANNKINLIQEWLRQKEESKVAMETLHQNFLQRKAIRLSVLGIAVAIIGIIISKWF